MKSSSPPEYQLRSSQLPTEHEVHVVPEELIAKFRVVAMPRDMLPEGAESQEAQAYSQFNDLGKGIPRDTTKKARTTAEVIRRVNTYHSAGSMPGRIGGMTLVVLSLGSYYMAKRRVVPAGYFGHYISSGRHMLKPPGIHCLWTTVEKWVGNIKIDDDDNLIRQIGSKQLVMVPENHIAGAFRLGMQNSDQKDGEFVLFGPGRHVLEDDCYYGVHIEKLQDDIVKVGPVTVLYVKEGFLGGAFKRNEGTYEIFYPGPAYLLHEQDFEQIDLVSRTLTKFTLGPIVFLTVKEGELGGAFVKASGFYQVLPPGNTYQLHTKDYEQIQLVKRSENFKLGPFHFLTVHKGFLAGVFNKKGGEFHLLPPGNSYQLNDDDFDAPTVVKRDSHVVSCGPLTFLTVQDGTLAGAYRTSNGSFEEFEDAEGEIILHQRDYYGLVTISKYQYAPQTFGPNQVVTIPEGYHGVFEKEGQLEIREPGFYKVSSQFKIRESLPSNIHTRMFNGWNFKTKDGIDMSVNASVVFVIDDPVKSARFPGNFKDLVKNIDDKSTLNLIRLCKQFSRGQLLPTQQDLAATSASDDDMKDRLEQAMVVTKNRLIGIESDCLESLRSASASSGWGVYIESVCLDGFELQDARISADLSKITQSMLATKAEQVQGRLAVAKAEAERAEKIKRTQAMAEIKEAEAESSARVQLAQAKADNSIRLIATTEKAKAEAEAQRISLAIDKERAEADADIQKTRLSLKLEEAKAEAQAITEISQANAKKQRDENEAAALMPHQEFELRRIKMAVDGLKHYGNAAWKYPDSMSAFVEELMPFLRLGPSTASEILKGMKGAPRLDDTSKGKHVSPSPHLH